MPKNLAVTTLSRVCLLVSDTYAEDTVDLIRSFGWSEEYAYRIEPASVRTVESNDFEPLHVISLYGWKVSAVDDLLFRLREDPPTPVLVLSKDG